MKLRLFLLFAALGVFTALVAQEGPGQAGSSTVAKPKKKTNSADAKESDQPKIPSRLSNKVKGEMLPDSDASFKVESNNVTVDVSVLDNKGHAIANIPKGNFRILEDNVPQTLKNLSVEQAPMTLSLIVEFSNSFQRMYGSGWYQTLQTAYGFLETLKKDDYCAIVAYDMRPEILTDFTNDRSKWQEAMQRLRIPAFSEANLYDTLIDTSERMQKIEGRKAILVLTSGIDTFSKVTYDKTRKLLQEHEVPIYVIGLLQTAREMADARGGMGSIQRLDFLQADNAMRTFAKETGGQAFFPRFQGELPGVFQEIQQSLRSRYTLSYSPSNASKDGKFRKIKVELVNPATNEPLPINDEKGKLIKYTILAKAGYTAPREVE